MVAQMKWFLLHDQMCPLHQFIWLPKSLIQTLLKASFLKGFSAADTESIGVHLEVKYIKTPFEPRIRRKLCSHLATLIRTSSVTRGK